MPATDIWSHDLLAGVSAPAAALPATKFRDESGWNVYLHEDFLNWFADTSVPIGQRKRARYCLRELLVSGLCARRKHVQGAAKGWIRTTLGGSGGFHYYLWWAPAGYPAVAAAGLERNDILVRAVRHHDATDKPLDPGAPSDRHIIDASFVLDLSEPDLTEEQAKAAAPQGAPVRLVRGFPGSGKTTALLQAGSHSWGQKALYLTFSNRLARESVKHFQTFAPIEMSTDVLTFGELLVALGARPEDAVLVPTVGVGGPRMRDAIQSVRPQLGPWKDRPAELYAELHAHALGRALPVGFKGLPAAPDGIVDPDALERDRSGALGAAASSSLAFAARHLRDKGNLDELFPTVRAARAALDRSTELLPTRFQGVSAVFVDEVQDLTAVEAMLVLTVVARIGQESGRMPQLIIAGDEAQTVRPTAFKWSWLADLVTLVLGPGHADRSDIVLEENLRSPRAVGLLIEATRSHYRLLDKEERPAGIAYTKSESETDGKVLYCHVPSPQGWDDLTALFRDQPSAQLVYPGSEVPAELVDPEVDIALSDQVKGLDFDLVGVVDAGERQLALGDLASKADDDPLCGALARTLADQFRVAVSRSRENLVLLDRGAHSLAPAIHELMAEVEFDPVVTVGLEQLADALQGDANPLDRLSAQLDLVLAIIEDDPVRALDKSRTALDLLRHAEEAGEVPTPQALATHRLFGLASALSAPWYENEGDQRAARERRKDAADALSLAGLGAPFEAARNLEAACIGGAPHEIEPSTVLAALESHPQISRELAPLEPAVRGALSQWVAAVAVSGLPGGASLPPAISALELTAELFARRQPEFADLRMAALAVTAERSERAGEYAEALQCYVEYDDPLVEERGRCLERLGQWEEAANLYEGDGRKVDALRCVREIPDLGRAWTLAAEVDPSIVGRLAWAHALAEAADPLLTDAGAPLTEAEAAHLANVVAEGVERSVRSMPSPDAPVDHRAAVELVATDPTPIAEPSPPQQTPELPGFGTPLGPEPLQLDLGAESGLVPLQALSDELGVATNEVAGLATKLGIRPVGALATVTEEQAGRIRRRSAATAG